MKTTGILKSFCTTREAAKLLGVSVGTIQLWVESGLLQAWKTAGGHRRVMRDSVENLLHRKPETAVSIGAMPGHTPATSDARLHVLIADSDEAALARYAEQLAQWPVELEVRYTRSGLAALLMIGSARPDLLIMDVQLTDTDGIALLQALRHAPQAKGMKIVVVTHVDAPTLNARGPWPDTIALLRKPAPLERLRDIALQGRGTA